jgi:catechol 2,3-dioxygenase-like lactoylglutathione lyase family enzyme
VAQPPKIDCRQYHAGLQVPDIQEAVDYYVKNIGLTLGFMWGEPPTFAGMNFGQVQLFLEKGQPQPRGASLYFVIGEPDASHGNPHDLEALVDFHRANGVEFTEEPGDRDYGLRDYGIRDRYGNVFVFGVRMMGGSGAPLKIERVDVPVRLEKRLAALLKDLAAHKGMSIDSALEEILLHTSEPLGDGVASPHTHRTLEYIQELKRKHGIDYDCHASYRFQE